MGGFTPLKLCLPQVMAKSRNLSASFGHYMIPAWKACIKQNLRVVKSLPEVNMNSAIVSSLEMEPSCLQVLCPLDGPYWTEVKELAPFMTEYAFIRFRVLVEIRWFLKFSEISGVYGVPRFSQEAMLYLQNIFNQFDMDDALEVKNIEKVTNEDVAVKYFLQQRCGSHPEISKVLHFFHFACSSEDVKNLAYALMLKEAINNVMLPVMDRVITAMSNMVIENASFPLFLLLVKKVVSPTTSREQMVSIIHHLRQEWRRLSEAKIYVKFSGTYGDHKGLRCAYPGVNWPEMAEEFVKSFGISFMPNVSKNAPIDYMYVLFDLIFSFNDGLFDFASSFRRDIHLSGLGQIPEAGDTGSSTMFPGFDQTNFENIRCNLGIANAGRWRLIEGFDPYFQILPVILWSEVLRFGHSLLAYKSALRAIEELQSHLDTLGECPEHKA